MAFQDIVKGLLDTLSWGTTVVIMYISVYAVWNATNGTFDDVHGVLLLQTRVDKNHKLLILPSNVA